jgi:DNA-binding Xre family transcriptional regulator
VTKELKLINYIENQIGIPFEFGVHDCPLFIAGAIDAMHDSNLREKYIGLWHDRKSAWKYAKKNGGLSTQLKKIGYKPVKWPFIQTGDIIVMEQRLAHEKKWHSGAIFTGSKVAVLTDDGVQIITLSRVPNVCEVLRCQQ